MKISPLLSGKEVGVCPFCNLFFNPADSYRVCLITVAIAGLSAMQLVVKKQHPGINREHCCDDLDRSTKVDEEVSYVVRISGCSVNVPATVNPKALFLLPLTPYMNFWCGIESGSFINLGNIAICW